jgi:Stage II sporulation protein
MGWLRRIAAVGTAAVLVGATVSGAAAAEPKPPRPITVPGGLLPDQSLERRFGDCSLTGVTCKPSGMSSSCTGYTSQTTPPATIRVYVPSATTKIQTISFQTYVENVLPNEWIPSWDGDALKAGAVAVKSYAWYWVTHFGGYLGGNPTNCFDVTDDTNFQVYRANSANTRTTAAVLASWPVAARVDGRVLQASYRAYLNSTTEACGAYADGSTLSQWGTQNCNEANTGNKYNVILAKYYYPGLQLATARQLRTQHDFQFLQRSTRVTFNAGTWSIDDGNPTTFHFGVRGDRPAIVTAGDGFAHVAVFRPSNATWYTGNAYGHVATQVRFGLSSDIAAAAQYAGVSKPTVIAVFRPSNGTWYEASTSGAVAVELQWGARGDIPIPGHYYGTAANDYADNLAVFRPSTGRWYVRGHASIQYGQAGDIPVPADYDGNGTTDIAVYRPSTHRFYVRGQPSVGYGVSGDVPVTGDFTGDGRADLVLYRPSTHTWYVHGSTARQFGASGATPIGKAPYSD